MRRTMLSLALVLIAAGLPACQHLSPPVEVAQSELGRVVVYRNGIAYYERKADVQGDKLMLKVPADKVDDFLKSLTVADVKTGKPLPISFPSRSVEKDGAVDMAIQLPDASRRQVKLTYITEAPAWKPSYRIVVDKGGQVDLEGWAIVDNTSGEDWDKVRVGVGSSSALSFRYDLHSIRTVSRETLSSLDTFAKAPPHGGSVIADGNNGTAEQVIGALKAEEIPSEGEQIAARIAGSQDGRFGDMAKVAGGLGFRGIGVGGGGKRAAKLFAQAESSADYKAADMPAAAPTAGMQAPEKPKGNVSAVLQLAQALKQKNTAVTIEGYAAAGESDADDKASERANSLRNQLIEQGVPPALVQVASRGVVAGQSAGVRIVQQKTPAGKDAAGAQQPGTPVGESHFESPGPMTVGKGTSAMVSIVRSKAAGEVVYLYDGESSHGDDKFAFRAVRFKNPTTSTLEAGPLTVYGSGRFIGEGLTDPIPPGATAVVPYALDRQVVVQKDASVGDRMNRLVKLVRGVLTAEVQHVRTTKLQVTNRLAEPVTVLVRHTVQPGWTVGKAPQEAERFGDARLYAVKLGAGQTQEVIIEEATPLQRTVDLRAPEGLDLVRAWLQMPSVDKAVAAQMQAVLALHSDMAKHEESIDHLRERQGEFRSRAEELQSQIFSLKLVRTAGSLMAHLQTKMKDTSEQVQKATVQIVDAQEKLMMARVKFQDALAELTLEKQAAQGKLPAAEAAP